jgi:hypothetical protein
MNFQPLIQNRYWRWKEEIAAILKKDKSYASVEDVYKWCCEGTRLFFDNEEAFAIMDLVENPGYCHLHIQMAGGTMDGLLRLYDTVAEFGRQVGAKEMTLIGRKGFARKLKKHGWSTPKVYMRKEL